MTVVEQERTTLAWVSDVAFEGLATGDGRWMEPGSLGWRELPLTLMAQVETADGHDGAQVAGRMDTFTKDEKFDMNGRKLPEGAVAIRGTGIFDVDGEFGSEIARMVEEQILRGISIDLAVEEWAFRDPDTGEILDPNEMSEEQWERAFFGELQFAVLNGTIMAATVVPTPAFAEARIAMQASATRLRPGTWLASDGTLMTSIYAEFDTFTNMVTMDAITASIAPLAPPRDWFFRPEANEPTPLTVTPEGEVYGHIALWDTCHTGFLNGTYSQCVRAPRSGTNYAHFHVGEIMAADGDLVPIGKLTLATDHANLSLGRVAARAHYDNTGSVAAFVRASDGKFGIWVSGTARSDMSPEHLRDLRANPPSGDWRSVDHQLELIAALAVPVPGFPVPRSQLALAASADGEIEVTALILSGLVASTECEECEEARYELLGYEGAALDALIDGGPEALADLIAA